LQIGRFRQTVTKPVLRSQKGRYDRGPRNGGATLAKFHLERNGFTGSGVRDERTRFGSETLVIRYHDDLVVGGDLPAEAAQLNLPLAMRIDGFIALSQWKMQRCDA
jgi:hypothetical protein